MYRDISLVEWLCIVSCSYNESITSLWNHYLITLFDYIMQLLDFIQADPFIAMSMGHKISHDVKAKYYLMEYLALKCNIVNIR